MVSTRELAVEAQARGFDSIFRFRRHSGHGRTRDWFDPVANDPQCHFAAVNCRIAKGLFDHLAGDHKQRFAEPLSRAP